MIPPAGADGIKSADLESQVVALGFGEKCFTEKLFVPPLGTDQNVFGAYCNSNCLVNWLFFYVCVYTQAYAKTVIKWTG